MSEPFNCAMEATMNVIEGKYKAILICIMNTLPFYRAEESTPSITQNLLIPKIRRLEKTNMIHREVYPIPLVP